MKKNIVIASVALSTAVLFSGCATILSGESQKINLQSKEKKTVSINGQQYSAPGVVSVKRENQDAIIKISECDKEILLKKEVNPTFFVNILSGGAFGSTTDYASDSMWQYDSANVNVDCE